MFEPHRKTLRIFFSYSKRNLQTKLECYKKTGGGWGCFSYQYRLGQNTGNETILVWFVSSFWNCLDVPGQVLKIEH